jgi:hypothetical protein
MIFKCVNRIIDSINQQGLSLQKNNRTENKNQGKKFVHKALLCKSFKKKVVEVPPPF